MDMNILVSSLEIIGYFRVQKPATYTLADRLFSHLAQPLHPLQCRGRAISSSMEEHFGTFHAPHLNLCSPFLVPVPIPGCPSSGAQWFPSAELTHNLSQHCGILPACAAGDWHWAPTPGSSPSPKSRHVLATLGGFCSTVRRSSVAVCVCMVITFG